MRWPLRRRDGRLPTLGHDFTAGHKAYVESMAPGARLWLRTKPFSAPPSDELQRCLHTFAHIAERFDLGLRPQVLDVGAGPGWLSELLARCGHWVTGIDISEDMTKIAAERIADIPRPIGEALEAPLAEFHALPVRELPWSGRFDLAVLYDTMHHFDDELETLRVLHRTLAPGGWIYIEEGVRPPAGSEAERHLIEEMEQHGTLESPFEPEYLVEVLTAAGFEQITRYARVDELFEIGSDSEALSLLRHRLRYPDLNTVVARKPGGEGLEPFRAELEQVSSALQHDEDPVVLRLAVTNAGRCWWPVHEDPLTPGKVTLGPYAEPDGARVELPRAQLPHGVRSGETVELDLVLPQDAVADVERIKVDLVREGIAWFSELGSEPLELELPR